MFVACGIWCLADVSSVSPSSELDHSTVSIQDNGQTLSDGFLVDRCDFLVF